jgi:radical SAM superfamily enzyme YgiQ (UPF0313 family)
MAGAVVLGGPEAANYVEEYLGRGADVVAIGEGEVTLAELVPAIAARGVHRLDAGAPGAWRHGSRTRAMKACCRLLACSMAPVTNATRGSSGATWWRSVKAKVSLA